MSLDSILLVGESTLRLSVPLIFAAMGGVTCERSGVINIALEGQLLFGAFAAATCAYYTGSPWLGLLGAVVVGALVAALYGLFVIKWRADQIVTGTAINILAVGTTPLLCKILFGVSGASPALEQSARFTGEPMLMAFVLVVLLHLFLSRTPAGLSLKFAGQHPEALACAGRSVRRVRWNAVIASGIMAAMGGAALAIYLSSSFTRNMSAGRGFMALAAMIFGRWQPVPAALACLLFGLTEALQMRLQGVHFFGSTAEVPVQLIQILPYVVTILVLAAFGGRYLAPRALGKPLSASDV